MHPPRKITWSKSGSVAYVTPDGQGVNVRAFKRDPSTGKWELGKDHPMVLPHDQTVYPIVHLSWSHLGTDLAVIDAAGRLMIFTLYLVLDRMNAARTHLTDHEDELSAIVGMHWLSILPHEKRVCVSADIFREYAALRQPAKGETKTL
jgi:mediator of RNA polymerase II transcription subunit 16, fungi type